ncbi:hypothetical protein BCR34DRAFT_590106 [Clohesyomyces aquaticus]|uniref:Uncharacterized protein n=1 Tax=Clohesyomyces aquaticus TaxID=1231657 RepID=A0A1Y1ZCS0_9PLEO|nr:hypothetical protein BCR34DRAFT_590106 [Clohesyomyces aquaticus]
MPDNPTLTRTTRASTSPLWRHFASIVYASLPSSVGMLDSSAESEPQDMPCAANGAFAPFSTHKQCQYTAKAARAAVAKPPAALRCSRLVRSGSHPRSNSLTVVHAALRTWIAKGVRSRPGPSVLVFLAVLTPRPPPPTAPPNPSHTPLSPPPATKRLALPSSNPSYHLLF